MSKEKHGARIDKFSRELEELKKQCIKIRICWTLGRYDAVTIMEVPSEKDAMKFLLPFQDIIDSETMVAIPREEAIKLLQLGQAISHPFFALHPCMREIRCE
ncbi:MAG: hypothetical protein JSV64_01475 [Candidatus Bathyarchaeota archaeon]|nr:MAG: hypothetical protein JSV64_01475 [Candidatus Bathyarchaeota archaeon]